MRRVKVKYYIRLGSRFYYVSFSISLSWGRVFFTINLNCHFLETVFILIAIKPLINIKRSLNEIHVMMLVWYKWSCIYAHIMWRTKYYWIQPKKYLLFVSLVHKYCSGAFLWNFVFWLRKGRPMLLKCFWMMY